MIEDTDVWVTELGVDKRVGVLRPSYMGVRTLASSSFEYDAEWIRSGWQVSPDLPLRSGRQYTDENKTLPGAMSDAAPDDWGQKIIRTDHARRRQRDDALPRRIGEFDFLLGVADRTRIGALRFRRGNAWLSDEDGVANVHDLDRIVDVAQRYEDDEASDEDVAYLNDVATSPGGARPKANVVLSDGRLAIAKLPHSKDGRFDVERWEAAALSIAEAAGLRTPRWSLASPGGGRAVLVSERFDRNAIGERLGYVSARTALQLGAHDDGSRNTYEDFADVIADVSSDPVADLREMYGRIALTVLVNNVDDHWRNHAFLRDADGWRLSPVFDVNPSRHRGVIDSRAISDQDDPGDRQLQHLLDVARSFRLTDVSAREVIRRVGLAVRDWRSAAGEVDLDERQCAEYARVFESPQLEWALAI